VRLELVDPPVRGNRAGPRLIGNVVAAATDAVWAIASSGVTSPSRTPSVNARPELVVASALHPSACITRAEPASATIFPTVAARFVSGYLYSPPRRIDGKPRVGGGHTHAWVRVYLPACGWVEFDPTNGIVGNTDLIRVGISVDPRQATPLYGSWSGFPDDYLGMDVEVDVTCREGCERQPLSKLSIA